MLSLHQRGELLDLLGRQRRACVVLPLASVPVRWLTTTAAFRRLHGAGGVARHAHGLVDLVVGGRLARAPRRRPPRLRRPAAAAAAPLSGAVAGVGGWLLVAPGTPLGVRAAGLRWTPRCAARAPRRWRRRPGWACRPRRSASVCEKSMSAVTLARRLSRPTTGSRSSQHALEVAGLDLRGVLQLLRVQALRRLVVAGRRRAARRCWSSTLTALGVSSGTLPETRCTMPAIWRGPACGRGAASAAPRREGFCCSRKKPFWLRQRQVHARRSAPTASDWIERVSSPSRPRWKFSRSWNWVWPKRVLVHQLEAARTGALGQAGGGELQAQRRAPARPAPGWRRRLRRSGRARSSATAAR